MQVFSSSTGILTDSMFYKIFIKHTMLKENDTIVKMKILTFRKGLIEYFLDLY